MTLVFAHRGDSTSYPEHTLPAFEEAIRRGVDGIECDVRLTADGMAVLWHDDTIDRCSNGTGKVSGMTLSQLQTFDVYHWRSNVPDVAESKTRIVMLEHLLELAVSQPRMIRLALETKHPVKSGGAVEREIARVLKRFGLDDERVMLMSFSRLAVTRLGGLLPRVPLAYLTDRRELLPPPRAAHVIGPDVRLLLKQPALVSGLHAKGFQVYAWTVDDRPTSDECRRLGVDMIATNRPGRV